uniref:Uncharacterized protein n=1 Tax=Parascaris univalens TaxID=6257 RepID=A0A915BH84_PARUN
LLGIKNRSNGIIQPTLQRSPHICKTANVTLTSHEHLRRCIILELIVLRLVSRISVPLIIWTIVGRWSWITGTSSHGTTKTTPISAIPITISITWIGCWTQSS